MSLKATISLTLGLVLMLFVFTGCGPQADLKLALEEGSGVQYKVTEVALKDFEFVQPALDKIDQKQSGTTVTTVLSQTIDQVQADGSAIATITILKLDYLSRAKEGIAYQFNSEDPGSGEKKLGALIGRTYRIVIYPDGSAKLKNASDALSAVKGGQDEKVVRNYLSAKRVAQRHSVPLPPQETGTLSKGDSWKHEQESPPGLLAKKTFEKVYTLKQVQDKGDSTIAYVEMTADPGDKVGTTEGMGLFANMFDTEETYVGTLKLDLNSGKVLKYHEKLRAVYLAVEPDADEKSEKGPDTLTMGFTHEIMMEAVN
jgi:hypothetical protein